MLGEELVQENADRRFLGVRDKLLVLPLVAEGGRTADGLAELRADRNGGLHAARDLLPLPLRHSRYHREEEAAGGA